MKKLDDIKKLQVYSDIKDICTKIRNIIQFIYWIDYVKEWR